MAGQRPPPLLEGRSLEKWYGGLAALRQVDIAVHPAEIVDQLDLDACTEGDDGRPGGLGATLLFEQALPLLSCPAFRCWALGQSIAGHSHLERVQHISRASV